MVIGFCGYVRVRGRVLVMWYLWCVFFGGVHVCASICSILLSSGQGSHVPLEHTGCGLSSEVYVYGVWNRHLGLGCMECGECYMDHGEKRVDYGELR